MYMMFVMGISKCELEIYSADKNYNIEHDQNEYSKTVTDKEPRSDFNLTINIP